MSRTVTAWIETSHIIRDRVDVLSALVVDFATLIDLESDGVISTSEPCKYRATSTGFTLLDEAFAWKAVDSFSIYFQPRYSDVFCSLHDHMRLNFTIKTGDPIAFVSMSRKVADFVRRWLVPVQATAAFVSSKSEDGREGDDPWRTAYERICPFRGDRDDIRRFARGAFWLTALNADLCAFLGGQERVLRDAPVFRAESVGEGVCLQLSPDPLLTADAVSQLLSYLNPLLAQSIRSQPPAPIEVPATHSGIFPERVLPYVPIARTPGDTVPMEVLENQHIRDDLMDIRFNIHLGEGTTREHRTFVSEMVRVWLDDAQYGFFGGLRFRNPSNPSINGSVVRWQAEIAAPSFLSAIEELRERLAVIPDVNVVKLVLGTETVG
ncbi:MAG: hypothetical protein ACR2JW_13090 [Thermomicrobiales bacterium]